MTLTLRLREILHATPRSRLVRIDLGDEMFPYLPGQALLIASHGAERRRPYSIAAAPEHAARAGYLELLVGVDAAGHAGPHLVLEPSGLVDVEGPVGRFVFPPNPEERRFVFIAGGTGIAPLRAMLYRAMDVPHDQISVFYSARTASEFAFEDELRALARDGRIELKQTVTREAAPSNWHGTEGRIAPAHLGTLLHDPATLCFICGPPALVDEMPRALRALGIQDARIRIEEWG